MNALKLAFLSLATVFLFPLGCSHDGRREWGAAGGVQSIHPLHLTFAPAKLILMSQSSEGVAETLEVIQTYYSLPQRVILDTVIVGQGPEVWFRSALGDLNQNPFRKRIFDLDQLKKIRDSSELESFLGLPELAEGPIDHHGTVIWQWRLCNGRPGRHFEALEITAALQRKGPITMATNAWPITLLLYRAAKS